MASAFLRDPTPRRANRRLLLRWAALASTSIALFGIVTLLSSRDSTSAGSVTGPPSRRRAAAPAPSDLSPEPRPSLREGMVPTAYPPPSAGHIVIPAIGVDAPLIPLGRASDGTLEVPKDWQVAGWFAGGPFPGEPGPAVVVGHVDSTSGPAVFYRLRELRRGDVIVVGAEGRGRSRFRVVSSEWFAKSAFPTRRVYGPVSGPALRLVTCGGLFDESTGHYLDNLVVFAAPAV